MIKPSIRSASGKGSHRLYSLEDVLCFRFVKRLTEAGWHTRTIRAAIRNLKVLLPDKDPLRDLVLLDANGTIIARGPSKDGQTILLDALSGGQLVMAFSLNSLREQVEKDIMTLDVYS